MRISKKRVLTVGLAAAAAVLLVPAVAFAAEGAATPVAAEAMSTGAGLAAIGKAFGAALAMGLAAIGAGMAQGKIGSAGQGVMAERPEERIWVITLTALPEIIVLLGFVMAILISGGE
jgi:V/A-type H+-transporting ATPase subunit K